MSFACITSHQLYYISSSLHHLDALHHLTSEYSNTVNLMYYTRRHMYYMGFTFTQVESRLLGSSLAKTQQRPSSKDSKCGRKSLSKRPSKRPNNQPSKEGARRGRSEVRARAAAQGVQQPKMVAAIQSDITSAVPWAPVTALCTQQSQRSAVSTASRPRLLHTVQWSRGSPGVL